jgi:uncharacterized protein (TIGR02246 family)
MGDPVRVLGCSRGFVEFENAVIAIRTDLQYEYAYRKSCRRRKVMSVTTSKPEHVATAFANAWNRHDMDEFASLFASDANFVNVVGVWWKNRSEIEAAHRATHETIFRNSRLEGDVSSVVDLAPGLSSVHYTWTLTGASTPGGSPAEDRKGILLLIAQEGPSGWRIKVAQNTDIVPGAIAPAGPKS